MSDSPTSTVLVLERVPSCYDDVYSRLYPSYRVVQSPDFEAAKRSAIAIQPEFIVVADVDEPRGYDSFIQLREGETTSHIPLLLVTKREPRGDLANELWVRRTDLQAAIAVCAKALSRTVVGPVRPSRATLGLLFEPGRDLLCVLHGTAPHRRAYVRVSIQECVKRCKEVNWNRGEAPNFINTIQNSGTNLHSLFWESEINGLREAAIADPNHRARSDLHLHFMGTLDTLDIPFEILQGNEDAPLAAVHPFSRSTIDATGGTAPFSPLTLSELARRRQKLRVLVAAGRSELHGAAIRNEVVRVRDILDRALPGKVEVLPMFAEETTRRTLASVLEQEWHIVHLAGHGDLTAAGLSVQAEDRKETKSDWVHPEELAQWLQSSRARFAYLSCCFGFDLFARKLVTAGIPALLAFRGQFQGERYLDFATNFYSSLHTDWDLSVATLLGRNEAYKLGNPLWAASVLHVTASTRT